MDINKSKQHVFRGHDDRCLYCDAYATDPDSWEPCEFAPNSAPDYVEEE